MHLPKRKTTRLKEYDYSSNGSYFVTICTRNRTCLFGDIVGATLCGHPNHPELLIEKWLLELENKYHTVKIDKYTIMPNHIHFILTIQTQTGDHIGSPLQSNTQASITVASPAQSNRQASINATAPLPKMIEWYKTMTTNDYIRGVKNNLFPPFEKQLWQRGYHEHVIRNEQSYQEIWEYIDTNPLKWADDCYHTNPITNV